MQRIVAVTADKDSPLGTWEVKCDTCPLFPHYKALNEPLRPCISGISTNMQGAITLKKCQFYNKDTFEENDEADLVLDCTHGEEG